MSKPKTILISGRAMAGKDTAAELLNDILPGGSYNAPYAKLLKRATGEIWGADGKRMITDPAYKVKFRKKLIALGRAVREIEPYTWVDGSIRERQALRDTEYDKPFHTVSDCRFFNEIYRELQEGGNTIHVLRITAPVGIRADRMGPEVWEDYMGSGAADDPSESQLDLLELPSVKWPEWAHESMRILSNIVTVIPNKERPIQLNTHLQFWWEGVRVEPSPTRQELTEAAYRLARYIGPEIKLVMP